MEELAKIYFHHNPDREYEKYMVGGIFESPHKHLTLRIWHEKKELDLHITDESLPKDHPDRYYTIFKISFEKFSEFGEELKDLDFTKILPKLKKMNVGKLTKNKCYLHLLTGDRKELTDKLIKFKGSRKSKGRFRENVPIKELESLIVWPEELQKYDEGAFLIYKFKRRKSLMNGYAFRHACHKGSNQFFFLSKHEINKFQRRLIIFFYDKLQGIEFENKEYVLNEFKNGLIRRFPKDRRFNDVSSVQ